MKIGRNQPCGSGKKYKKCCLDKEASSRITTTEFRINLDSLFPKIEGLDDVPDLKEWLKKALQPLYFSQEKKDLPKAIEKAMQQYNKRLQEVNTRFPKPYGVLLKEIKSLLEEKKYEEVITQTNTILEIFPESAESLILKDSALFSLQQHPLQEISVQISKVKPKEKQKLFEKFRDLWRRSSPIAKEKLFGLMERKFYSSESWEGRYAALDIVKNMWFIDFENFSENFLERFDRLLIKALADNNGRVRNQAVYCVSHRRGFSPSFNLFFDLYEAAQKEKDIKKRRAFCRAILELVAPITDQAMKSAGVWKDYQKAIDLALEVTGYNQEYYKANFLRKMMINLRNPRLKMKKK